jgi:integrase
MGYLVTRIVLPYLSIETDRHGNDRYYVRRGGKRKRIRETPGTPAFLAAYQALLSTDSDPTPQKAIAATKRLPGSLGWLCQEYFKAAEFTTLGPTTRHARRLILDRVCETAGEKRYRMLESKHIRSARDKMADRPEAANSQIKALRQLFKWAINAQLTAANPAEKVPYLKSKNPDGFHTWTLDEVAAFEARHPVGTKARLALTLLLYTGVRRSDVIHLGPQMIKDGWLSFTEAKGRARKVKHRQLPVLAPLKAIIDATPVGHLNFLVTEHGKPYSHGGFGNWFGRQCRLAGLKDCSAHGLRKAGATIAADNGATEFQLMAIYGWESAKQAAVYTRRANRRKLAGEGMHFISIEEQAGNTTVSPQIEKTESETKSDENINE